MQQRVGCDRKDENYKDLQVSTNNRLLIRNEGAKFQFCTNLFTEHGASILYNFSLGYIDQFYSTDRYLAANMIHTAHALSG